MPPDPPETAPEPLDVIGVGSPLVDILAPTTDDVLERVGLEKGSMELVDLARAEHIYAAMGPTTEMSGGSAANTVVGVAALGGRAGFVGKVGDDTLGRVFSHDIAAAGVVFGPVADRAGSTADAEATGTGRCLVLVTGEGERTMATHLGVATTITPEGLPLDLVVQGRLLYLEGYLWDLPPAKEAMRRALDAVHDHDGSVALTLSDSFCVERHRRDFLDLVNGGVDVLFANEEEIISLFSTGSFDAAVSAVEETGLLAALTRGAKGSVVVTPNGPVSVPAAPVDRVVDTTGAGDLFAAGFLFGLTRGAGPEESARLGGLCAAEIISHLGARPQADLRALAAEAGLTV
ncbi:MAG TPA: adenosine kinase [Acidimicrobiales bacterium]|nr:adenosine kinase [Acidimicrobiales bacterium]